MGTASEPSTWGSKFTVTQLVFLALRDFALSTPCVCALRGVLPGRVFPYRTTRRHGLARLPRTGWGWLVVLSHARDVCKTFSPCS